MRLFVYLRRGLKTSHKASLVVDVVSANVLPTPIEVLFLDDVAWTLLVVVRGNDPDRWSAVPKFGVVASLKKHARLIGALAP